MDNACPKEETWTLGIVVVQMHPCFNQAGFGLLLECAIWFTTDRANKARCPCALPSFEAHSCGWYSVPRG